MCIICVKPAGVEMPEMRTIENMWDANSDGAGIMYNDNSGGVVIKKGFMKLSALKQAINNIRDAKEKTVVIHCRITTHGGTKPENCHPFPVSDNVAALQKLVNKTRIGVAHNGIIDITPRKGISDTMEYIVSQIALMQNINPLFYTEDSWKKLIKNAITSKMVFLDGAGRYETIGEFIEDNEDGCLYSNHTYEGWSKPKAITYPYSSSQYWDKMDTWGSGYGYGKTYANDDKLYDNFYSETRLMSLWDWENAEHKSFFIVDKDGNICDDDWDNDVWAVDSLGNVYKYDWDYDTYYRMKHRRAIDEDGSDIEMIDDLAVWEYASLF